MRLFRRARRQLAYWHHLNTLVGRHTAAGYRVSLETYQLYQKQARKRANLAPPDSGPRRAAGAWPSEPGAG